MWIIKWLKSWWNWFFPVKQNDLYEFKYPLNTLAEETDENKKLKRVEENTPEGHVYMTYDEVTNTFLYWSNKAVAYKYLDVLARKYVIVYDCKEVYVNIFREIIKSSFKKEEEKEEKESPYATFKSKPKKRYRPFKERTNLYKYLGKWTDTISVNTYKKESYLDYKKQLYA